MKSKNFASICTGTSTTCKCRDGTLSVVEPQGAACAGHFNHEVVAFAFLPVATRAHGLAKLKSNGQLANQDGISQRSEISTLSALSITRIGGNASSTGPQAGQTIDNNPVTLSTTYTSAGVKRAVGAVDLEANGFFSEIPPEVVDESGNPVTITEAAQALPQMNGSGMVRSLQAAMSLSCTQADELEAALTAFAAATTRDAQRAQLDTLITEWAQTSSYWSSLESTLGGTVTVNPPAGMTASDYRNMIAVLEAFNGSLICPVAETFAFELAANRNYFSLAA